jgi:hypothetical protein
MVGEVELMSFELRNDRWCSFSFYGAHQIIVNGNVTGTLGSYGRLGQPQTRFGAFTSIPKVRSKVHYSLDTLDLNGFQTAKTYNPVTAESREMSKT